MWMVRRSYEEFRTLDAHLHQCIYDRRYSLLLALPALCEIGDQVEVSSTTLDTNGFFLFSFIVAHVVPLTELAALY